MPDQTKLRTQLIRQYLYAQIIKIPTGAPPKLVTVRLLDDSGAAQMARWHGSKLIAVDDVVQVRRDPNDSDVLLIDERGGGVAIKNNFSATAAPTTGDDDADGYSVGSLWIDVTNDNAYICLDASTGAAVWQEFGVFTGPGSSTDNAIVRFDGTGGNTLQNTGVTIDDNDKLTLPNSSTYPPLNVTERSSAPSTPASGDIYLDDGTNTASGGPGWRRYNGSTWEDVGGGGGDSSTLTVRNNSGGVINAGVCGYLVGRDFYAGTAGNPSQRVIVVTGGADGADVEVQNRGNCSAFYTGTAPSAGDPLKYDGIGSLTKQSAADTDTIAYATAAGSGGSVAVLLVVPARTFGYNVTPDKYRFTGRLFTANDFANHKAGFQDSQGTPYPFGGSPGGFSLVTPGSNYSARSDLYRHHLYLNNQSSSDLYLQWTDSTAKTQANAILSVDHQRYTTDTYIGEIRAWAVQSPGGSDNYYALRFQWKPVSFPDYPLRVEMWRGTGVTFAVADGTLLGVSAPMYDGQMCYCQLLLAASGTFVGSVRPIDPNILGFSNGAANASYPSNFKTIRYILPGKSPNNASMVIDEVVLT